MNLDTQFAQLIKVVGDTKLTFYSLELTVSDSVQGICGPRIVPVNGTAVHQRREVAQPVAEGVAQRAHAEANVQVSAYAREVAREDVELGRWQTLPLAVGATRRDDRVLVLDGVEVGHIAGVEDVVQVFNHGLVDHLRVRLDVSSILSVKILKFDHDRLRMRFGFGPDILCAHHSVNRA